MAPLLKLNEVMFFKIQFYYFIPNKMEGASNSNKKLISIRGMTSCVV
jgi:hypothetical protein